MVRVRVRVRVRLVRVRVRSPNPNPYPIPNPNLAEHLPARGALVRLVPLLPPARPRMALAAIAGGQLARPAAGQVVQDTASNPTAVRVSGKEGVSRRARVVRHRGPRLHDQPTAHNRCRGLQVHREDRQLVVTCDDALIHGSWRRGGDAAEVSVLRSGLSRCDVLGSDQAGRHPNSTSALSVPLCRGCHLRRPRAARLDLKAPPQRGRVKTSKTQRKVCALPFLRGS